MKILKKLLNFYINSSIHVAFAVLAFTGITFHYFDIPVNTELLCFIFFATITGYNLIKYAEIAGFRHLSLPKYLRVIQIFSFLCFLALMYFAVRQPIEILIAASILALLNFLYGLPFISQSNLRSVAGIKIFIIAFVWAGTTVLLPLISTPFLFQEVIVEFLQRFLLVIVLMIPFEIRDLKFDKPELGTLPHVFGIKKTRYTGLILLFLVVLLELMKSYSSPSLRLILLIMAAVCMISIMRATEDQNTYYSSFWVEGIPIFWWILIMFSH